MRLPNVGDAAAARALAGTLAAEKNFLAGRAGQKIDLTFFRLLRKPELCEASPKSVADFRRPQAAEPNAIIKPLAPPGVLFFSARECQLAGAGRAASPKVGSPAKRVPTFCPQKTERKRVRLFAVYLGREKKEREKKEVCWLSCYDYSIAQGGGGKVDNLLALSEQIMNVKTGICNLLTLRR